jgi:two-component system chemotaxis sensor kinase CheA
MSDNDELLGEFLVESSENLDHLDEELVQLETEPTNKTLLNAIFRRVHTIKGVCGFLDFHKLESVTHAGENLLQNLRSGELSVNSEVTTVLLRLCDAIRAMLVNIEATGNEGSQDYSVLIQDMLNILEASGQASDTSEKSLEDEFLAILAQRDAEEEVAAPAITVEDTLSVVAPPPSLDAHGESEPEADPKIEASTPESADEAVSKKESDATDTTSKATTVESSLRVDVALLDQLMNLAGELVLARNQILQITKSHSDTHIRNITQRLSLVTSELQEGVMKTRMQQIATVWNKFPRVVRDVAKSCGKSVRLEMEGKETELDKTIIEAIKDPLTHIIRNSIDHGIESPQKRALARKPEEGVVVLRAFHEGGYVMIEISDDGGGLDTERIRAKAVERGLMTADRANRMSEPEVHRLIFAPGFSTAEKVTNISGRGVGMDVVKSNIERIGGQVDVVSRAGTGSTMKLKIPLTLAIIPTLIVSCGKERFAIPQVSIVELVRMSASGPGQTLQNIGGTPFYKLRGDLLPLLFLKELLKVGSHASDSADQEYNIVVVKVDSIRFGIVVDVVHDTEEIVVKPLGRQLKTLSVFAGATIMGDGQIALIVDVVALGKHSGVYRDTQEAAKAAAAAARSTQASMGTVQEQLLVVQISGDYCAAIPLNIVSRLEEFSTSEIENAAGHRVVQYREGILTVIDAASALGVDMSDASALQVVVVSCRGVQIGVQVERIVDIVSEVSAKKPANWQRGIKYMAVINKKVTAVLDVESLIGEQLLTEESDNSMELARL